RPSCIYPLCDGKVMLEWSFPDGVVQRIEVRGPGRGQLMTTFPDAPGKFQAFAWPMPALSLPSHEPARGAGVRLEDCSMAT
ncbi:MAG: hypothetical protein K2W96_07180, partial [Gemmataceae bacterium]|nr:hypothetical protein [Gemmataceae bacterium]